MAALFRNEVRQPPQITCRPIFNENPALESRMTLDLVWLSTLRNFYLKT